MDFTEALSYSFKAQNIPKILTIVLVAIITGVTVFVATLLTENPWFLLLLIPIVVGYGLFVSGYSIEIIGHVIADETTLPSFKLGRDIWRGVLVFFANIVYSIPMLIIFGIGTFIFASTVDPNVMSDDIGLSFVLGVCGFSIFGMALMFAFHYSLVVGQVRYAVEGRAGALFNIGKNFGIMMSHLGSTLGLFARTLGIVMVIGVLSSIVTNVISAFFSGVTNQLIYSLDNGDFEQVLSSLGLPMLIFGSLYYIMYLSFSLMQNFSLAHLMAGYGIELGLSPNKLKTEAARGNTTAIMLLVAVFVLFALVACGAIILLTLLGPVVGDVFSEIIQELD